MSCVNCCHGLCICMKGCGTRIWLGVLSVLQFSMCMATYFSPIAWVLGPFAFVAMACAFVAMFFKWRQGLIIFLWTSGILFVLALIPLITLANNYQDLGMYRPHRLTIFGIELALNAMCLMVGSYVLCCEKGWLPLNEENESLLGMAKNQAQKGKKAILEFRPPKSWV